MNLDNCRFVIFGVHNIYSTHSHIHEAMYRILKYMGREVYWVDYASELNDIDLDNTFFISEGHFTDIPIVENAFYAIHNLIGNPSESKFKNIKNKFNDWGMLAAVIKETPESYIRLDPYSLYSLKDNVLLLPWATDQTPEEIEKHKKNAKLLNESSREINWVGYVWPTDDIYTNHPQLTDFSRACKEQNIEFIPYGVKGKGVVSIDNNIKLIRDSYFSPALQGSYQVETGYIPCRILKNISYGCYGVTNSSAVNEFLGGNLIYNNDCYQLFYDAKEQLPTKTMTELYELMDFVAEYHTYVNRINIMLQAAKIIL